MAENENKTKLNIWSKRNRWISGIIVALVCIILLIIALPRYLESQGASPIIKFFMVMIFIAFIGLLLVIGVNLIIGDFQLGRRVKEETIERPKAKVDLSEGFRDWTPARMNSNVVQSVDYDRTVSKGYGSAWEQEDRRKKREAELLKKRKISELAIKYREDTSEYLIQKEIEQKSEMITREITERKLIDDILTTHVNTIGMRFVPLRRGEFLMGDNRIPQSSPEHKVSMTEPFHISVYPVTQEQWEKVMGSNPSPTKNKDSPVVNVSYNDCMEFVTNLNNLERVLRYRLPSETQWEYACRAGSTSKFSFGDDMARVRSYAWTKESSEVGLHPVGLKDPNLWNIYDMHGNVWEWCIDRWHDNYKNAPGMDSPFMDGKGSKCVVRGGSYKSDHWESAYRTYHDADYRSDDLGFRVVMIFDPLALLSQGAFALR